MFAQIFPLRIRVVANYNLLSRIAHNVEHIWLSILLLDVHIVKVGRVIKDVYVHNVKCTLP
jgi:hypothetical protein